MNAPSAALRGPRVSSIVRADRLPRDGDPAFDDLLDGLPMSFAHPGAAEQWLDGALRSLTERIHVDRVELFSIAEREFRVDRSWPPAAGTRRLSLDRSGELPWLSSRLLGGSTVIAGLGFALPDEATVDRTSCTRVGVDSFVAIPLRGVGEVVGALCLSTARTVEWGDSLVGRIHTVARAVGAMQLFTSSRRALAELRAESERLRVRIERDGIPPAQGTAEHGHREIVGRSSAILRVLEKVEQVASTSSSVLLLGETGTGKELVARAIHEASERRRRPMVKVNCAALPSTLVESELFGREKGAYTGALSRQAGRFELADGSTIFLDEIGELAPDVQVKLLRVLQEGEFERIGSTTTQKVNVRVIAATNRDLAKAVREGRFREDLYYRLNVFPIRIPPLRERYEDIPVLVWTFVEEFGRSMGRLVERIPPTTIERLQAHGWPGNVRELRNVIERAMIVHRGSTLQVETPEVDAMEPASGLTLEEVERRHLIAVLESAGWRIRGRNGAAERLALKPTTLESRLEKLGIGRPAEVPPM